MCAFEYTSHATLNSPSTSCQRSEIKYKVMSQRCPFLSMQCNNSTNSTIRRTQLRLLPLWLWLVLACCRGAAAADSGRSQQQPKMVLLSHHIDRTVTNKLRTIVPAISARVWSQLQVVKRELRSDLRAMKLLLEEVAGAPTQAVGGGLGGQDVPEEDASRPEAADPSLKAGSEVASTRTCPADDGLSTSADFERNLTATVSKLENLLKEGLVMITEGCVREVEENNQAMMDRQREILRAIERLHLKVDLMGGRGSSSPRLPFPSSNQAQDPPRHCREAQQRRVPAPGDVTIILPSRHPAGKPQRVRCDQTTAGGGWTVVLHRQQQQRQLSFRRDWREYEEGFGDPRGEYWIGLRTLHDMTRSEPHELLVVVAVGAEEAFSSYANFSVGSSSSPGRGYRLRVAGYSPNSTAGDALSYHNGMPFTTYDADNDVAAGSCSLWCGGGGWWYNYCFYANPTGIYPPPGLTRTTEGDVYIEWRTWQGYYAYLTRLTMMVRPTK